MKNYSPVPYWDMWDGYLDFYVKASSGDWSVWWAQHNEHRIFLARLLFWIDISIFDGQSIFLIIINYLLLLLTYLLIRQFLHEQIPLVENSLLRKTLSLVIFILIFSWLQRENLIWGFQSQFVLAQFLPLLAFFLIHKSHIEYSRSNCFFITACIVGVLAVGTMANGILTLPLMSFLAILLGFNIWRIVLLVSISLASIFLYFYNYTSPEGHGSITNEILENPIGVIEYFLVYIGKPFYYFFASLLGSEKSLVITKFFGLVFVLLFTYISFKAIKTTKHKSINLCLVTFLIYICGSGAATAGGRLAFGVDQALSSRYFTPVLIGWSILLVLYAPIILTMFRKKPILIANLLLIMPILLIPEQLKAKSSNIDELFEREIAVLALEMNIREESQIKRIFPFVDWIFSITSIPIERNLSVFGHPRFKDVRQLINSVESEKPSIICQGSIEHISPIIPSSSFSSISGWLFSSKDNAEPSIIHILNEKNIIIGYAITGQRRKDLKDKLGKNSYKSGFKGYVLATYVNKPISLQGLNPSCILKAL